MSEPATPAMRAMQCITGHWVAAATYAAARLKLADHLHSGPKSSGELATMVGAHAPSVYRLLRGLSVLGLVDEIAPDKFAVTEAGDLLRADHPNSLRPMAMFQGSPAHWRSWGAFADCVETGQPAFARVNGLPFFDYCENDAEFAAHFHAAMAGQSAASADALLDVYDFAGVRKIIDIGGGQGHLLTRILQRHATLRGGVFDLPSALSGAQGTIAAAGVADRCELVGGSFFDSVPPADTYIAKHIIHDWDDEHSLKILTNMRRAMVGQGRVLLVETLVTPENKASFAALIDLEMLHATHGGRERTREEFASLFAAAGFKLNRVVPTKSWANVIEGVPA